MALALARLGLAAVHEGRLQEAATQLDEALQCVNLLGFAETGAWCCEGLALVAASSGEHLRARASSARLRRCVRPAAVSSSLPRRPRENRRSQR